MFVSVNQIERSARFEKIWTGLSVGDRQEILSVMSQAAERSYRRGTQQGITLARKYSGKQIAWHGRSESTLYKWRYDTPLDKSIGLDGRNCSSKERFCSENGFVCMGGYDA